MSQEATRDLSSLADLALALRRGLAGGDENPVPREFLEQGCGLGEVRSEHVDRIAGKPHREVDGRVMPGVKTDQNATSRLADVLDGMAVTLRNVTDVSLVQGLDPVAAVRAEERDAHLAVDHVLPLVGG